MIHGERFQLMRKTLNLSVDEIASLIGTHRATIYRWEADEPNYTGNQIITMKNLGINPMYPFGIGDVLLPGYDLLTVQRICKAIIKGKVNVGAPV